MEHRHGTRYPAECAVHLGSISSSLTAAGTLTNVSISGCFIHTTLPASLLTRVGICFLSDDRALAAMTPEGQIIRCTDDGVAVEWSEYQSELLRHLARHSMPPERTSTSSRAVRLRLISRGQ